MSRRADALELAGILAEAAVAVVAAMVNRALTPYRLIRTVTHPRRN